MTNRKKMALAGLLVLVMVASAVMGTLAYLTDTDSLDNTFVVGAFTKPTDPIVTPDNPDPDPDPDDPDPTPTDNTVFGKPTTFIYEPYWNANGNSAYTSKDGVTPDDHRLLDGETTVKDPYIGIGKKSEDGYVLAYIKNPMGDSVYFSLGKGWKAIEGDFTKTVTITAENGSPTWNGSADTVTYYSQGLFAWVGTTGTGESEVTNDTEEEVGYPKLAALTPTAPNPEGTTDEEKAGADAWTKHPVFSRVYTAKGGVEDIKNLGEDNQKMTVYAYIHQTRGIADGETEVGDASSKTVIDAAKLWAGGIANPVLP